MKINDVCTLIERVHVLLAHEADAEVEYTQVLADCDNSDVSAMLEEIRRDERNHMGKLLRSIAILDPDEVEDIGSDE